MRVVIVGAGVAGLSIGWRLAQSGAEVVILERAQPGRGATWASGGMIAPMAENAAKDGPEARFAQQSAAMWPKFAAAIEQASGRKIAFRRDGSVMIAASSGELEGLSQHATAGASLLSRQQALELEPMLSNDIAGALWAPDDAQVDNRALGLALAHALVHAGGIVQTNEAAVLFEFDKERIRGVRTPFATYEGDAYIITAGAWSGEFSLLPRGACPPIVPVKGEMIALAPPADTTLPIRLVWGKDVYLIPRHDRIFVGATASREGFDTGLTREAEAKLLDAACRVMPGLRHWVVAEHWAGLRPGSPDDLPILGETTVPGLFVASGQYRNGILFAPAIADALRRLVLEHQTPPEIAPFDPKRFLGRMVGADVP